MTTATERVVLVGCGGMSRAWLDVAKDIAGLQVVGLVDLNREVAMDKAKLYNLDASVVFGSLKEALAATKPNVVFDVTIPAAHDAVTIEALEAGCHVLGEKPLAESMDKARRMVAAAKKARRTYAVMQNRRYDANLLKAVKPLRDGQIGTVEEVYGDFFIGAHFGGFRAEMPYPLLVDMAIHTFDVARVISDADPVAVYCHSFNPGRSWYKGDASATCIYEMRDKQGNDIVYTYRGSWCSDGKNTSWNTDWRVIGSKGSLLWDGAGNISGDAVVPAKEQGFMAEFKPVEVPDITIEHSGHGGCIRDFVDCIRTGRVPQTHCEDNIKSLAMVFAAIESAEKKQRVEVKW